MRVSQFPSAFALLAVALACFPNGASAQGTDAQRQACTPDAMRLCSDVIPDVARVTACMKAKYRQLSPACRVAMRGPSGHHGHYHHYRHCHHC
jgi:hypothetical protein